MLAQSDSSEVCGESPGNVCEWVYNATDSSFWAEAADWLINRPLRIIIILALGVLASRLLRRSVRRFGARVAERSQREFLQQQRSDRRAGLVPRTNGRSHQRANTLTAVMVSLVTAFVWLMVGLIVLGEFNVSIAPLLAGAGVLSVVLAFGAQSVVADFLAGIFMLIEDQFGVDDVIDVGEVTGTVEKVSLRVTTLRDVNGTVWHVPNSEITRVANKSQLWSRAVLDVQVAYDTDLRLAQGIIQRTADELWKDEEFTAGDIIDPPEVWGIEELGADGVVIRLVVKTDPAEQWVVARELRLRIKDALDEAGIEFPFPQRTIWIRSEESPPSTRAESPAPVEVDPVRRPEPSDDLVENPE